MSIEMMLSVAGLVVLSFTVGSLYTWWRDR